MEDPDKIIRRYNKEGWVAPDYINDEEKISFTFHSTTIEGSTLT